MYEQRFPEVRDVALNVNFIAAKYDLHNYEQIMHNSP